MGKSDPTFPVIDLSAISSIDHIRSDEYKEIPSIGEVINKIGKGCEEWGFFQVINHGVTLQKLEKLDTSARKFFSLSMEEKTRVCRDGDHPTGYIEGEHTENNKDWKEVFDFAVKDPSLIPVSPSDVHPKRFSNRWPKSPPELREAAEAYAAEVEKLASKLMSLISLSLGLATNRFDEYLTDEMSLIKINYYPSCPTPDCILGIAPHKDANVLTVLAQDDVGGLQVKRKSDGEWVDVKPIPGSFIINVGDVIQVWSNGKYESVEHRARVNSVKERVSIGYFVVPSHYALVKPLEELISEENPAKFQEFKYGQLYATKRKNDMKKVEDDRVQAELLQISHFEITE